MSSKGPLAVRFTNEQDEALSVIAEQSGLSRAEVVRMAVAKFLKNLNEKGEIVVETVIRAPRSTRSSGETAKSAKK